MMDKIWGQACAELEQSVGPNNYNHWIKPLRLMAIDDGAARISVIHIAHRSDVYRPR